MKRTIYTLIALLLTSVAAPAQKAVDLGLSVMWADRNVGADSPEAPGIYVACGKTTLEPEDDIATVMLGSDWRYPTNTEITELVGKCTWEWIADDDAPGYRVTGPNGNAIFLPAAGIRTGSKLMFNGHEGYYWTSESMYVPHEVFCLRFTPRLVAHSNFISTERWHGCVVRAVTAANIE